MAFQHETYRAKPSPPQQCPPHQMLGLAIPVALYRPEIGPPAAKTGKKMAKKSILAPPLRRGKNGPLSSAIFSLFCGGVKIHFLAIFSPFRAGGPIWGLYRATGIAMLGTKTQPNEKIFGADVPRTSGGHSGGRPGSKTSGRPSKRLKQTLRCRHP